MGARPSRCSGVSGADNRKLAAGKGAPRPSRLEPGRGEPRWLMPGAAEPRRRGFRKLSHAAGRASDTRCWPSHSLRANLTRFAVERRSVWARASSSRRVSGSIRTTSCAVHLSIASPCKSSFAGTMQSTAKRSNALSRD
jgi:hypothetical protein